MHTKYTRMIANTITARGALDITHRNMCEAITLRIAIGRAAHLPGGGKKSRPESPDAVVC